MRTGEIQLIVRNKYSNILKSIHASHTNSRGQDHSAHQRS